MDDIIKPSLRSNDFGRSYEITDERGVVCRVSENDRGELEFRYEAEAPYAWMRFPSSLDDVHTIRLSRNEKAEPMGDWLRANGLCVLLQRDLHHSESPHLTGDRQE